MKAHIFLVGIVAVMAGSAPQGAMSEEFDAKATIKEMAAQATVLSHVDTIYRLTEELVFWQSVVIMAGEFDWVFSYNTQETEQMGWTIRLNNVLGDSETEFVNATRALKRQRNLSDAQQEGLSQLGDMHVQMREIATQIHSLLLNEGDVAAAQELFKDRTMQLRRDIANKTYSFSAELRSSMAKSALKARLAN